MSVRLSRTAPESNLNRGGSVRRHLAEDLASGIDDRLTQRQVGLDVVASGGQLVEVVPGVAGTPAPGVWSQRAAQGRVELRAHGLVAPV